MEDVDKYYSDKRQQAKAVTFGIMYGAGPAKISWQVTKDSGKEFSMQEAQRVISDYFQSFPNLRKWLNECEAAIKANAFLFILTLEGVASILKSKDKGIASHEVRSGINFLVQSVASDINLLGAIDIPKLSIVRE